MSSEPRIALIRLLDAGFDAFSEELARRLAQTPYNDIRATHGCVFGNIEPEGSRLTDLAERAHMTKQTVGEVATELERRGYLERAPDPSDGRAKIIRLTERGREAQAPSARSAFCLASVRVMPVTWWPAVTSRGTSCLPIAPVAPATKILISAPQVGFAD